VDIKKAAISAEIPEARSASSRLEVPAAISAPNITDAMTEELNQAGNEVMTAAREAQKAMISSLDLQK